jgi:hypothetical protein
VGVEMLPIVSNHIGRTPTTVLSLPVGGCAEAIRPGSNLLVVEIQLVAFS